MYTLTTEFRKTYIRTHLLSDPRVGVGGTISYPYNRCMREIVYLRLLMSGAIFLPVDQLLPAIERTIVALLEFIYG